MTLTSRLLLAAALAMAVIAFAFVALKLVVPQIGSPAVSASDKCSPEPCIAGGGVTLAVSDIATDVQSQSSYGPASPDGAVRRVVYSVTFADTSGDHQVSTLAIDLRDSTGAYGFSDSVAGADCDSGHIATLHPGDSLGPFVECKAITMNSGATLKLQWVAPDGRLLELPL